MRHGDPGQIFHIDEEYVLQTRACSSSSNSAVAEFYRTNRGPNRIYTKETPMLCTRCLFSQLGCEGVDQRSQVSMVSRRRRLCHVLSMCCLVGQPNPTCCDRHPCRSQSCHAKD